MGISRETVTDWKIKKKSYHLGILCFAISYLWISYESFLFIGNTKCRIFIVVLLVGHLHAPIPKLIAIQTNQQYYKENDPDQCMYLEYLSNFYVSRRFLDLIAFQNYALSRHHLTKIRLVLTMLGYLKFIYSWLKARNYFNGYHIESFIAYWLYLTFSLMVSFKRLANVMIFCTICRIQCCLEKKPSVSPLLLL